MTRDKGRSLRTLAAVGGVAGAGWLLAVAGPASVAPPLGSAGELAEWLEGASPPLMAVALLRLVGLVACGYLGLVLVVAMLAEAAGWRRMAEGVARVTPSALRHLAVGGAQLSLTAGTTLGLLSGLRPIPAAAASESPSPPGAAADEPPPATAVLTQLEPDAGGATPPPPTATMVELGPDDAVAEAPPVPTGESHPAPEPPISPAPTAPSPATWTVGAGDSFWSIAATTLAERSPTGRAPEADVARYWCQLITANRDRLVAPDHPDLLLPGQTLLIPEPGR